MPKSRNRRSNGKKKKKENQESSAASGTMLGVRRGMANAAGAGERDNSLRMVGWILVGLIGLFLTITILAP